MCGSPCCHHLSVCAAAPGSALPVGAGGGQEDLEAPEALEVQEVLVDRAARTDTRTTGEMIDC